MVGAMQRQEDQIVRLQELMAQQASAQADVERPTPPVVVPGTVIAAEKERALAALVMFRKFDPPVFDGEKVKPWMVESWIDSMDTLFDDLCTLEKDKVHLATHCLERTAKVWWRQIKRDRSSDLPPLVWEKFRGLLYTNYFPDSEKKKLQDQFRKLRQGNRSVGEYEREFSHIIGCVPDVVRGDRDRANCFERGLRPDIYKVVHILKLTTFSEVLDWALWAEHGNAHIHEEREASEKDGSKKRAPDGSGGQSRSRKPPKYLRTQSKGRGARRCIICGGDHDPKCCKQKEGRCYACDQAGHMSRYYPGRTSPAPSIASAPATLGYYGGAPPTAVSAGRAMPPRQPEVTRSAPSGRVFAAQAEEPTKAEERNVVVGMVLVSSRAMFDIGATHLFISRPFAEMHGIEVQLSKSTCRVEDPERAFVIRKEYLACPVQVGNWIMLTRLLVLKRLKDFDLILGMDWLSKYYASIDCKSRVIIFRKLG
ncbi:uncharacterized protein LOC109716218 [Ananas comosus]|uniref:Uncharacterized protein LOC109716218 n=1 Tax=Ananas comosus TaxID=4615 RepID=A0A6P5FUE8_ANACO|nr:uncharacterized protein LOC109716218 [Ananas comosus]